MCKRFASPTTAAFYIQGKSSGESTLKCRLGSLAYLKAKSAAGMLKATYLRGICREDGHNFKEGLNFLGLESLS